MTKLTDISIVCTVYNDKPIVPILVQAIIDQMDPLGQSYEIVLVDDHSTDGSDVSIQLACQNNERVKAIRLSRNFGQQIAASAGIIEATGNYVVVMDGDLQNPVESIPQLIDKIREGFDIVYTVSKIRNNFLDGFISWCFWVLLRKIFGVKIIQHQLMMKIMTRSFVQKFIEYGELSRVVAGITHDIGMKSATLQVVNKKRTSGRSKNTATRKFNLMLELIFNLTTQPLNMLIYFGFLSLIGSTVVGLYHIYMYLTQSNITPGYTSVILSIFFFGSLMIIMLGIISRYLANIYLEVKRRPMYIVETKHNFEEKN